MLEDLAHLSPASFLTGPSSVKLENKGDLSFLSKQAEVRALVLMSYRSQGSAHMCRRSQWPSNLGAVNSIMGSFGILPQLPGGLGNLAVPRPDHSMVLGPLRGPGGDVWDHRVWDHVQVLSAPC